MTEYEKLLAGEFYDGRDAECRNKQKKAKNLALKLNNLDYNDREGAVAILKELLGSLGEKADILPPFNCDYGIHTFLGEGSFVNYGCSFLDTGKIEIGKYAMIGPDVKIYTANHPLSAKERYYTDENGATFWKTNAIPVKIGDYVWIGGGSIICPGVVIGSRSVIGAGSVVTKSIPENVIAAGNPCKVIRENY